MNLHFSWSWGNRGCGLLKLFGGFRSAAQLQKINHGVKETNQEQYTPKLLANIHPNSKQIYTQYYFLRFCSPFNL
ncbi:uncharacterized protein DS421_12g355920 [Arachis hypogaea]|nr:uncharacterized protein DS421_12g355920 [Arachis hypogaea]